MKKLFLLLTGIIFAFSLPIIKPYKFYRYNYYISKVAFNKKYLIVGLENGHILINDFKTNKKLSEIVLPKIHDFMGNLIAMPIYSLDISPNSENLLILTQGENATRILSIYNFKTKKITKYFQSKKLFMQARYINNNEILLALLSDEVLLYNLKTKKFLYDHQIGNYVFSTFALNKNKTKAVIGDESGVAHIINTKTGKKLEDLIGYNKNKTIALDFVKNYVINGSDDKRVAIYNINTKQMIYKMDDKFLPYAVALSPKLDKFSLQYDENNNILVSTIYGKPLFLLKGHQMPLINMKFLNENTIISYSPSEIIIWKLKEKK